MNVKRVLAWLIGFGVLAALLAWAFAPQPVPVETAVVRRGHFEKTVDEDGKTRVRDRYVVSSPLAGTLARIDLTEGDAVGKGDIVATIAPAIPALLDPRTEQELTARLEAAEADQLRASAEVGRAEAALDLAKAEAQRIEGLAAKGFVSAAQRDTAVLTQREREQQLDVARQQQHAAGHALDAARAALAKAIEGSASRSGRPWPVRAPVSGTVLRVLQKSESPVVTGAPLLEIGDTSDLEVVVDVLSSDAVAIAPGNRVRFERWGGDAAIEGRVRNVERAAFTKISALGVEEQRVNVIIDIVAPDERWKRVGDGFRVESRIVVEARDDVLTVPVSALFRAGERWLVFTAADGRAHERAVALGPRSATDAVVEDGLQDGEQVIVYPGSNVGDGVRIARR